MFEIRFGLIRCWKVEEIPLFKTKPPTSLDDRKKRLFISPFSALYKKNVCNLKYDLSFGLYLISLLLRMYMPGCT